MPSPELDALIEWNRSAHALFEAFSQARACNFSDVTCEVFRAATSAVADAKREMDALVEMHAAERHRRRDGAPQADGFSGGAPVGPV